MDIQYLPLYYANKDDLKKRRWIPRGMTLTEIEAMELTLNNGNAFPKALREYLFIGGKFNGIGFSSALDKIKEFNDFYQRRMRERGIAVGRPCFVFDQLDGECPSFIYLDEGDDPKPWNASLHPGYDMDDEDYLTEGDTPILWKMPARFPTFSSLVEYAVDAALKGLQPW